MKLSLKIFKTSILSALVLIAIPSFSQAETCLYRGTSDYSGKIEIKTVTWQERDLRHIRVLLSFQGRALLWKVHYLMDETSAWRGDSLQAVATNARTVINGDIKRQNWDVWHKEASGLEGYRIQGKESVHLAPHGDFAKHWPVAAFGGPWLQDYAASQPSRRTDLDLGRELITPDLRSGLAAGLYWSRFLPATGIRAPIFIAGEKKQKIVILEAPAPIKQNNGSMLWQMPLRLGTLQTPEGRPAQMLVSAAGHLEKINLKIQHELGSAEAEIKRVSCQ